MKDFGKMIQNQKPAGHDTKCAEIKTLPTAANNFSDKQKNIFKIGEYNRATASFEMNSTEDLRQKEGKLTFDLTSEAGSCHYFKSSFARSIVINDSSKCKSMDHYLVSKTNGRSVREKVELPPNGRDENLWILPGKENWDLRRAQPAEVTYDGPGRGSSIRDQSEAKMNESIIDENPKGDLLSMGRPGSRGSFSTREKYSSSRSDGQSFDEVRLKSPLMASRRCYSSASDVDSVILHSQITTLQWQLRQAEASRQMYRAVMEQVVSFLQKTHRRLDALHNRFGNDDAEDVRRVPRSRSVHAVGTSPCTFSTPKPEPNSSFHKAKSLAQFGGSPDCPKHGSMYRDMSWRKESKQSCDSDDLNPSKLSEEAFRLLRTVKSLLRTREPDLTSRLNTSCSSPATTTDASSASSTISAMLESDNSETFRSTETVRGTPVKSGEESRRWTSKEVEAKGSPLQLSISSADDESGFSSLNSFQDIGIPTSGSTFFCQRSTREVGMPEEDVGCKVHRRWSSIPVSGRGETKIRPASLCANGENVRVLWV